MSLEVERLREAFDRGFEQAPVAAVPTDDYLAVRVGADGYALALSEVAGLHKDRRVVRLVSPRPHLLGVAGFRGAVTPVFDLRTLLGYPGDVPARWLVLARGPRPLALAFDAFDSYLRVPRGSHSASAVPRRHLSGAVASRPVIHLASIFEALEKEL